MFPGRAIRGLRSVVELIGGGAFFEDQLPWRVLNRSFPSEADVLAHLPAAIPGLVGPSVANLLKAFEQTQTDPPISFLHRLIHQAPLNRVSVSPHL